MRLGDDDRHRGPPRGRHDLRPELRDGAERLVQDRRQRRSRSGAALKGSTIGLRVDPAAGGGFVIDNKPRNEKAYRARFWYDPNSSLRGAHTIFEVGHRKGRAGLPDRGSSAQHRQRRLVDPSPGPTAGGLSSTGWYTISDGPHAIELAWKAGARASFSLSIDGKVKRSLGRLDTHRYRLESVRLGTSASGPTGTEYFDEFVSTKGSRIGP